MNTRIALTLLAVLLLSADPSVATSPCNVQSNVDDSIPTSTPCSFPFGCFISWFLSLLFSSPVAPTVDDEDSLGIPYYDAFANLRSDVQWPMPESGPESISSTFGPRQKFSSGGRYDWHRGVDINGVEGDEVQASYPGVVVKAEDIGSGGLTVILEHVFKDSDVYFHSQKVEYWYSVYNHLSNISVAIDDEVKTAGQKIGEVGKTGASEFPHLHHELRLGSRCSLEYAVENPSSGCNTFGFDPHVHPLLIYPSSVIPCSDKTLTVSKEPSSSQDSVVSVTTEDRVPDVNRYNLKIIEPDWFLGGDKLIKEYTLDLNLRIGYDSSSLTALDTQDTSKPHLAPQEFLTMHTEWVMDFVIPRSWVGSKSASQKFILTVTNIWDDAAETIEFGSGISW